MSKEVKMSLILPCVYLTLTIICIPVVFIVLYKSCFSEEILGVAICILIPAYFVQVNSVLSMILIIRYKLIMQKYLLTFFLSIIIPIIVLFLPLPVMTVEKASVLLIVISMSIMIFKVRGLKEYLVLSFLNPIMYFLIMLLCVSRYFESHPFIISF